MHCFVNNMVNKPCKYYTIGQTRTITKFVMHFHILFNLILNTFKSLN